MAGDGNDAQDAKQPKRETDDTPGKGKEDLADLGARERCVMTPLVVAMLVLGIWSAPLVSALTPVAQDLGLTHSQVGATAEGSAQ